MALLQTLDYTEYKKALALTTEQCEVIAKLANLKISFESGKPPGQQLMKILDRRGFTVTRYNELLSSASKIKTIKTYYKPYAKVAILIANDKYKNLPKLATPCIDCDSLAANLTGMGFIVVLLKNIPSKELRHILTNVFALIPRNSYCFTFYAGHGCEIGNIRCMLSVDCPAENIEFAHCITENFVMNAAAKSKVELCIIIMDMCRLILDRAIHPQMYRAISTIDDFKLPKNFIIGYSTQQSQAACEVLQIECSTTIKDDVTYELQTGDTDKIIPGASLYVNSLCTWLSENLDVSSLLDKVHEEVEGSPKNQRPIKVQCGTSKKSLYDPATGDIPTLLNSLKDAVKEYQDNHCVSVF